MARIRALLVDDEVLARVALRQALDPHPDFEVVGECGTVAEAQAVLPALRPDLLFLDIQMPGGDGFTLAESLPGEAPYIVFVTAHQEHALRAFQVQAVDYLLKPLDQDRVDQALARVRRGLSRPTEHRASEGPIQRISLPTKEGLHILPVADIDWVQAEGNYIRIHAGGRAFLHRETLNRMERLLGPERFLRIHRGTLVNLEKVAKVIPLFHGDGEVRLKDGTRLPLSRRFRGRAWLALGLLA